MDGSTSSTTRTAPVALLRRGLPRLVVVDQHAVFADALEASLEDTFRVRQVAASASSTVAGIVAAARSGRPHLALVTSRLGPFLSGVAVIDGLVAEGITVVALHPTGADLDPVGCGRCLRAGAIDVASQDGDLATLQDTLGLALVGRSSFDETRRAELLAAAHWSDDDSCWAARGRLESLTPREREIVTQLVSGHGVTEIARESVVAEATVRTQLKSILAKLEVRSQLAAVALVHRVGRETSPEQGLAVAS